MSDEARDFARGEFLRMSTIGSAANAAHRTDIDAAPARAILYNGRIKASRINASYGRLPIAISR